MGQTMTWGRGFFRIWVAISALYVLGAVLFASMFYKDMKPLFVAPKFEVTLRDGTKHTIDTADEKSRNIQRLERAILDESAILKRRGEPTDSEGEIVAKAVKTVDELYWMGRDARTEAFYLILKSALGVLLPPLILLTLGYIIAWIVRGFRVA